MIFDLISWAFLGSMSGLIAGTLFSSGREDYAPNILVGVVGSIIGGSIGSIWFGSAGSSLSPVEIGLAVVFGVSIAAVCNMLARGRV